MLHIPTHSSGCIMGNSGSAVILFLMFSEYSQRVSLHNLYCTHMKHTWWRAHKTCRKPCMASLWNMDTALCMQWIISWHLSDARVLSSDILDVTIYLQYSQSLKQSLVLLGKAAIQHFCLEYTFVFSLMENNDTVSNT